MEWGPSDCKRCIAQENPWGAFAGAGTACPLAGAWTACPSVERGQAECGDEPSPPLCPLLVQMHDLSRRKSIKLCGGSAAVSANILGVNQVFNFQRRQFLRERNGIQ